METHLEHSEISAEMQRLHDHYDGLGRALTAALNADDIKGGGWAHRAGYTHYGALDLAHPRGLGIWLRHQNSYRKGAAGRRLTVGGSYPTGWGGRRAQETTVAMDRHPHAMARDITCRLLPDYLATLQVALEEERKAELKRRARIALNRRLEQLLPNLEGAGGDKDPARTRSYWWGGRFSLHKSSALASGRATVSLDAQTVDLKLSDVPAELALQIIAMVNPRPQVVEGTIVARALPRVAPALEQADRIIPGELVRGELAAVPVR